MRYLSQEELIKQKDKISDGSSKLFMHCLITMCKELPDQQWQTIDEFKANTVEGWCWVDTVNLSTKMCFFSGAVFYTTDELTGFYVPTNITHVMPIKTPEAPK